MIAYKKEWAMADTLDLREIERRAQTYWNVDGLPELMMGLLWILWGGSWLFGQSLPRGDAWNVFWMFTPALLVLSGVAAVWATKKLKTRITFPRMGYVEWKGPTQGQRFTAVAVAMATASLLVALIVKSRTEGLEHLAAPGLGALLSLAFVVASLSQKAPHLLALAGVALILGLAFGTWKAGWDAMNWMLIGLGAATVLLGAVRLWMFLRTHPQEQRV
jgi:hypothetical protein